MTTILIKKNVMVPMRDGVRLTTDVYRLDRDTAALSATATQVAIHKETAVNHIFHDEKRPSHLILPIIER